MKFNEKQLCPIHESELGAQTVTEHHLCAGVFLFVGIVCFWMSVPAKQLHGFLAHISFLWGKRWENMGLFVKEVVSMFQINLGLQWCLAKYWKSQPTPCMLL